LGVGKEERIGKKGIKLEKEGGKNKIKALLKAHYLVAHQLEFYSNLEALLNEN
jgi:hypothetical protein